MKKRNASANWQGPGKTGKGTMSAHTGAFKNLPYSFSSRFEDGAGTNPEELIAASHAGCFSMKLSFVLVAAGFEATNIDTTCTVTLENGSITNSHLKVTAHVPGISQEAFQTAVEDAKVNCPVSKLLKATITHEATLKS